MNHKVEFSISSNGMDLYCSDSRENYIGTYSKEIVLNYLTKSQSKKINKLDIEDYDNQDVVLIIDEDILLNVYKEMCIKALK